MLVGFLSRVGGGIVGDRTVVVTVICGSGEGEGVGISDASGVGVGSTVGGVIGVADGGVVVAVVRSPGVGTTVGRILVGEAVAVGVGRETGVGLEIGRPVGNSTVTTVGVRGCVIMVAVNPLGAAEGMALVARTGVFVEIVDSEVEVEVERSGLGSSLVQPTTIVIAEIMSTKNVMSLLRALISIGQRFSSRS